ncbi:MAG: NPCBM/NEW2 domain-containing protein, partial [Planctomycetota bacterium]
MIRLSPLFVLAVVAFARAEPSVILVDGREFRFAGIDSADTERALLDLRQGRWEVPTVNLVAVHLRALGGQAEGRGPINLFLSNGDRLRGTVRGEGSHLALEGGGITGLRVPLSAVRAVRFGRLLGGLQARYSEVFERERAKGHDVVVVRRDTRPFPIAARVLSVTENSITVLTGDQKRDLAAHKVYGFVRAADPDSKEGNGALRVRLDLHGAARITLPLEKITNEAILGGGATVARSEVARINFRGPHLAHLSDFEPISVKEVGLFGDAPGWRRDRMVLGGPLQMDGRRYERGLGVHAYSRLEFVLRENWRSLFVRCGIDDAAGREGAALFRILADGKLLAEV